MLLNFKLRRASGWNIHTQSSICSYLGFKNGPWSDLELAVFAACRVSCVSDWNKRATPQSGPQSRSSTDEGVCCMQRTVLDMMLCVEGVDAYLTKHLLTRSQRQHLLLPTDLSLATSKQVSCFGGVKLTARVKRLRRARYQVVLLNPGC